MYVCMYVCMYVRTIASNLSNTFTLQELTLNKIWKILLGRNILNMIQIQRPYGRYFRGQTTTVPHPGSSVNTQSNV